MPSASDGEIMGQALKEATILMVDDQEAGIAVLRNLLSHEGYRRLYSTTDPREAVTLCQTLEPDLLLLDLHMPQLDGFAVVKGFGCGIIRSDPHAYHQ